LFVFRRIAVPLDDPQADFPWDFLEDLGLADLREG